MFGIATIEAAILIQLWIGDQQSASLGRKGLDFGIFATHPVALAKRFAP
jgi:hypothetical protein